MDPLPVRPGLQIDSRTSTQPASLSLSLSLSLSSRLAAPFPTSPHSTVLFPSFSVCVRPPGSLPLCLAVADARRPLAFQVEWIFISELAGRSEGGSGGRSRGREGEGDALSPLFPSFPKEIMREYWTGEKRWRLEREEERTTERERVGGEPIRPTNRPEPGRGLR